MEETEARKFICQTKAVQNDNLFTIISKRSILVSFLSS